MRKLFSVPIIGAAAHSEKTKQILARHVTSRNQSEFIRDSIMALAIRKKFGPFPVSRVKKPEYIAQSIWQKIITLHQKSYYIDYIYAVAFYYLLSLPEFTGYNKSKLLREIIETTSSGCL